MEVFAENNVAPETELFTESENETDEITVELVPPAENQISKKRKHENLNVDEKPTKTEKLTNQKIEDEENDDGAFCPIVSCLYSFLRKTH